MAEQIDARNEDGCLAMSFVTWAELLQDAEASQRREATLQQLDDFSHQMSVLDLEREAIYHHDAKQAPSQKGLASKLMPTISRLPVKPSPLVPR